jgi:hypothetical protein
VFFLDIQFIILFFDQGIYLDSWPFRIASDWDACICQCRVWRGLVEEGSAHLHFQIKYKLEYMSAVCFVLMFTPPVNNKEGRLCEKEKHTFIFIETCNRVLHT